MNLTGKSILITGGSIGIGFQMARLLSEEGAKVMVCARDKEALINAKSECPNIEIHPCDVTNIQQVKELRARVNEVFGGLDVLVNNAAIFRRFHILEDYPLEDQLLEIDINLKGPVLVTNVFLKDLLRSKAPVIVNLTSPSAYMPMAASQIYSATKSAIQSWTVSLRHQLKKTNVRVVELNPPAVDTRMNSNNPDLEGMKLMSAEKFAQLAIKGIKKEKNEILISHANIMKQMTRLAPGFAFKVINKS